MKPMTQKNNLLFLMPKDIYQSWPFANDFTKFVTKIPAVTFPQLAATLKNILYTHFDGQRENISFKNYLWLIGGWSGYAKGFNDVWFSKDGISWQKTNTDAPWAGREDLVCLVFQDKIWMMGGMLTNGKRTNDVWFSVQ